VETGWPVFDLIQSDWDVFSDRLLDRGIAARLLEAIMASGWDDDDGEPRFSADADYVRHRWSDPPLADVWQEFVDEVKRDPARPLAFRGTEFDEFLIREELRGRRAVCMRAGTVLYRARLGFIRGDEGPKPFADPAIGAPPLDKAGPGRASVKGRAVLYCADEKDTAVAEVRPALGEYVSVAELRLRRDSEILDLATKPNPPNPFVGESRRYEVEFEQLLWAFAEQLAKPLRSRDDVSDYIPTQKLADAIKKAGLAGIRYPSAMAPGGTNVVLLVPAVAEIGASRLVEIMKVRVEYRDA